MDDTLSDARSTHDVGRRSNRSHDLSASLTRFESNVAGIRRRTILFACWGVIVIAATAVRIIAEVWWP
jgi:hypothetical protein